ncbi:adenine deaminase C-terminal domain-containing protein, partial [Parabacteroides goldsteinii]|uniref:adenine deaminase C-terminal domain-containing protein n=1 Tax=Parabacteroides goldsteinii TaxID=328812 RepID=UPI00258768A9
DCAAAANHVAELGGGIVVWDGGVKAEVPLPIAGIMSDQPLLEVNEALEAVKRNEVIKTVLTF